MTCWLLLMEDPSWQVLYWIPDSVQITFTISFSGCFLLMTFSVEPGLVDMKKAMKVNVK